MVIDKQTYRTFLSSNHPFSGECSLEISEKPRRPAHHVWRWQDSRCGKSKIGLRLATPCDGTSSRIWALVVSDSRGAGISRQVNRNQKLAFLKKVRVDIRVLPGATPRELWNAIANANAFHLSFVSTNDCCGRHMRFNCEKPMWPSE